MSPWFSRYVRLMYVTSPLPATGTAEGDDVRPAGPDPASDASDAASDTSDAEPDSGNSGQSPEGARLRRPMASPDQ